MKRDTAVAVVGTFDSKGQEHLFLKRCIERRNIPTVSINVGTKGPSPFRADFDLYEEVIQTEDPSSWSRDEAIRAVISRAQSLVRDLHREYRINEGV